MDTSLRSLKQAFKNQAFSAKYDNTPGVYAFVLITPADTHAFEELVGGYEEIHWATGNHIRVIGPSITVDNQRVSRQGVAYALPNRFNRPTIETFKAAQTRESHEFARFIDLPQTALPAVVFFDSILAPTEYVVWSVGSRPELVNGFRSIASHLNHKCGWRILDALAELETRETPAIRILESKLRGQNLRIEHRTEKMKGMNDAADIQRCRQTISGAERKKAKILAKLVEERSKSDLAKERLFNQLRGTLPPLNALAQWNEGKVKRYTIEDIGGLWAATIASAHDYSAKFKLSGRLNAHDASVTKKRHSIFISYAHKDNESPLPKERWLDRLLEHLAPLQLQGEATIWSDLDVDAGEKWHATIQSQLRASKIAVLLVSSAFLASRYIRNSELPVLLKNAEREGLVIVPVVVSPCLFTDTTFKYPDPESGPDEARLSDFQSINPPSQSLVEMSDGEQHRTLLRVAQRVIKAIR